MGGVQASAMRSPADIERIECFAPIARRDATLLILGSMPGAASLAAGQYYAHPRNAFWPILASLLAFDASAPYQRRVACLKAARIAVWDVLQSCRRRGSLDTSIERETQVANDFAAFLRAHASIRRVLFNGGKAEDSYRRFVLAEGIGTDLRYGRLPSTSPANASWSQARKLAAWRAALAGQRPEVPGKTASRKGARA